MRWSLDNLYTSFDSREFLEDNSKVLSLIEELKTWSRENFNSQENAQEKIQFFLGRVNELSSLIYKIAAYSELSLSVDAKNNKALMYLEKIEKTISETTEFDVAFKKWLSKLENVEEIINSSEFIKEHEFILKESIKDAEHMLSDEQEIVISKMKNTGSSAWAKLQEFLTSTHTVEISLEGEEKKLPLPVVRNMAYSEEEYVRKTAYFAELKSYQKIENSSAAALNGIKGEVITLSKLRGYESPLHMTLKNSRMDKETLNAMLEAIREYLPYFRNYLKKKAELLGHKSGKLPFYDLFAPIGKVDMKFTYDEARKFIVENFKSFSSELADFADRAFEENWIDAEPREGKRGGAFCYNLHPIKESRILANFDGSFSNVTTIAHELGHAYHGNCLIDETFLNSNYPMPIAETASIFCETLIIDAALKIANREEKIAILENSLQSSTQTIVDIYSRFLFEDEVFKRREDHSLSVEEFKEIMLDAQKKAYGDALDEKYMHPYMWVNKPHYYYADANYYNFPYAFGELFVRGLIAEYKKRGSEFAEDYKKLLSLTGKNDLYTLGKEMGFDLHSVDFWRSSLEVIKEEIDTFISATKSSEKMIP
ncbi:M3 family oligoendopeptidase [Caloramator proteoclasticus]|uniref:Oligoendopeptidase, pepF/M3 family n=1 Tax=Caloramator proteoclasticus DSM 10124 TaxID=1121262 RepID=A0A1M5BHP9_9CLOT|nr:M3 family oligoendopeptidase [Caloramator proteoclasticus]SHF42114.1 oligoendopeptidase, pepF/M3 family [Caloramator proteoclasticus DSM 10124]